MTETMVVARPVLEGATERTSGFENYVRQGQTLELKAFTGVAGDSGGFAVATAPAYPADGAEVVSARERLRAAALARLRTVDGLTVFDAPPVRASLPHGVLEEPELSLWGAAGLRAFEGRLVLVLHDAGERPERLRTLGQAAEEALGDLSGEIGGGWRLPRCRMVRTRLVRSGSDRWRWTSEFAVKLFRMDG